GQLQRLVQSGDQIPSGVVGTLFSEPSINESGDVAYSSSFINDGANFGVFLVHNGQVQKVVADGDLIPDQHTFFLQLTLPAMTWLNNNGDILFQAEENPGFSGGCSDGLFLSTKDGFKRVEFGCDQMPAGGRVVPDVPGLGTLNDKDEVAF